MRHPIRHLVPVAVLATVLALVAGCGGGNGVSELPKAQPPTTSPTPVDPDVTVAGIDPTDLDVSNAAGSSPGVNLSFASPIYTVTAASALTAPTQVQLLLDNALPRTVPVFVVSRQSAKQPWVYQPGRLMSDQRHVQFTTSHLGDFAVVVMDLDGAKQSFQDDLHSRLDFSIDKSVKKPECADPKEARRDGYAVTSSIGRKTVFWCFGFENGKRVLRVVNRRVQPIQLSHLNVPVLAPTADGPEGLERVDPRRGQRRDLPGSRPYGDLRRRRRADQAAAAQRDRRHDRAVAAGTPGHDRLDRGPAERLRRPEAQDRRHDGRPAREAAVREDDRPRRRQDARRVLLAAEDGGDVRQPGPAGREDHHRPDDEGLPPPAVQGGGPRRAQERQREHPRAPRQARLHRVHRLLHRHVAGAGRQRRRASSSRAPATPHRRV